ncbi:glycerol-3-phosphate 1-O-acyltransferase PlsY [Armatimonas rosea]|uniref:Glycerol-3-phosphate acyltransferase n=1 Tax=Armatimonas rosea TaxID=685828 RepID=A0A7W9SM56_ARMRO|nr:glycerol-3-phosphate 1-O-acyltransferase PlsY [Armatimonas rosea]MBB6048389.1 glycerol-3-phosphate acyltransferase PlsY [Armatimonas rosea]
MPSYVLCLLAFFVGAIPFGLLIGKLKGIDLREKGSGNIGASNAMRQLGKPLGILVFVLDTLKGLLPTLLAHQQALSPEWVVGVGLAAVFGHIYSPFVRFKGGKGVATTLGVLLGLDWRVGLLGFGVFLVVTAVTDYISVGSITAAVAQAALFWVFGDPLPMKLFGAVVGVFVILRHRSNIQRLLKGEENHYRKKTPAP